MLAVGHYYDQLVAWRDHTRDALHLVPTIALKAKRGAAVREVARRVLTRARVSAKLHNASADPQPLRADSETTNYVRRTGDVLDDRTRRKLEAYYAPHDAKLWRYLADHREFIIPRPYAISPTDATTRWW